MTQSIESNVAPSLARRLKEAGVFAALLDVRAPRFVRFLMQPRTITRNGWMVDPEMELEQSRQRSYVLQVGSAPVESLGQRLCIDREERRAHLYTYAAGARQHIVVDLESLAVLENHHQ